MIDLLHNPVIWASIATLVGALVGSYMTRQSSREDIKVRQFIAKTEDDRQDFDALHTTVLVLQSEQARLRSDIQELREQVDSLQQKHRRLSEKYSSAVAYINLLLLKGKEAVETMSNADLDPSKIPEPPINIVEDLASK